MRDEPLKIRLKKAALELGFDDCRVTSADLDDRVSRDLDGYLGAGHHGTMGWMADTSERRSHPRRLWPDARSVVVLTMNYAPDDDPMASLAKRSAGTISVYARNRDYHDVIKGRLKQLAGKLAAWTGADVKVFVDTAPVMEKPLAERAGAGWQGKHTNLVSREFGSWLFLGSIFTTAAIEPDDGEIDHCGSCRACMDVCPTDAFPAPYRLDARRCISYLTIEHAGPIPRELRSAMGNRIYGCDDCLAACPWNKFARTASETKFAAREDLRSPSLAELSRLTDAGFRALFSRSPIKRIGRNRFIRNVLIAVGNSGDPGLKRSALPHLADDNPVVRAAAVWALAQLCDPDEFARLHDRHGRREEDGDVREEWAVARDQVLVPAL